MAGEVIHFEIHADDPERAAKFYRDAFGWQIHKWDGPVDYWLVTTTENGDHAINGAIKDRVESLQTVNTLQVDSIEDAVESATAAGGKLIQEKREIPGVGYHAYLQDSEGNIFGIMQPTK